MLLGMFDNDSCRLQISFQIKLSDTLLSPICVDSETIFNEETMYCILLAHSYANFPKHQAGAIIYRLTSIN